MTSPEKATEYLSRVNWKTMMEWLTAEAILNRPIDPVQFCRDVLGVKLTERSGGDFRAEALTDWLRSTYTEASSLVDEHGIIHGKSIEEASQSMPEQLEEMRIKMMNMAKILDACRSISSLDPEQTAANITSACCRILDCDRCSLFTLDSIAQELILWMAEGVKNIRVPLGEGIAGSVAATGETSTDYNKLPYSHNKTFLRMLLNTFLILLSL